MLAATWGGSILQILTLQVVLIPGGRPLTPLLQTIGAHGTMEAFTLSNRLL